MFGNKSCCIQKLFCIIKHCCSQNMFCVLERLFAGYNLFKLFSFKLFIAHASCMLLLSAPHTGGCFWHCPYCCIYMGNACSSLVMLLMMATGMDIVKGGLAFVQSAVPTGWISLLRHISLFVASILDIDQLMTIEIH